MPRGVFYADIRPKLLPRQEVYVNCSSDTNAYLTLKGVVNAQHNIVYRPINHIESKKIEFVLNSPNPLEVTLKRVRCELGSIIYDPESDTANIDIKLPMVGHKIIQMRRFVEWL